MSYSTDIRAALRTALQALPGTYPTSRSWEGRAFTPVVGTAWMREAMMPSGREASGLGLGAITHTDLFQIDLFFPVDKTGTALSTREGLADGLVDNYFRPGTGLAYGSHSAVVLSADRSPAIHGPEWSQYPVTLRVVGRS